VDEVLERLGLAAAPAPPRVAVLAATNRPEFLDRLLANFEAQGYANTELIVITNSERFDREAVDSRVGALGRARVLHLPDTRTLGECLNVGLDATDAQFVAKFDDDDHYGAHYLLDAVLSARYADAAIIGKKTFFAHLEGTDETILRFPGNEFTFTNRVSGSTLVINREHYPDVRFDPLNLGEDTDLFERALRRGLPIFSTDRYNYVAARRADPGSHSWTVGDQEYRIGSVNFASGLALDRTMI
jgi:glycosyltransferase involved in cell wall biosynthesis